ncbi:AAA family ATPase [Bradyrhizobium sp. JYMT SZCCT0428]|nr:AAA family ATPase [Bradyrhizobium sp. JYMT SZCCT0428]
MALGCRVAIVQIPSGKVEGWDAVDCIAEGGDAKALIDSAVVVTGHAHAGNAGSGGTGNTSTGSGTGNGSGTGTGTGTRGTTSPPPLIKAKPFILRDPKSLPKQQWIYGRHLIRKFGSATFAPSGSGKTNIFIIEGLAIATGRGLLGVQPPQRARVWLWNGEDPYDELERRVGAACLHYDITPEEVDGWLFINSGRDPDSRLVIATQGRDGVIIAVPVVEALIQTIRDNKIDVAIIDPFISSHNVTENDNNAVDAVAKTWTMIADICNIAIDLGHHTRKTNGTEVTVEDGRGAVALLNAVRPARVLNVMTEEEAKTAGISDGRKRYFRITDGKNNLSLPVDKREWFRSATVNLGNGDPNDLLDRGDSMGVVTAWKWPNPLDGVTGADFDKAAVAIRAGEWKKSTQANNWVGYAVAKALKLNLNDRANKAKVVGLIKVWLASGALVEVEKQDDRRKTKIFIEVADED